MCWISFLFLMKLQTQYQSLTSKNQNFSFQFFEWVSIKSRSTYIYNLYLYQYRNWLHWKYVKQNLHQIPLAILDAVIFKLQFDYVIHHYHKHLSLCLGIESCQGLYLLLQQWNRQLLRIFENDVITRFIDNFSFEQCSIYPESTYTYTQWMSTNWPAVACWE